MEGANKEPWLPPQPQEEDGLTKEDIAELAVTGAGFVPGLGTASAVGGMGIAVAKEDAWGFFLSAVALVPVAGGFVRLGKVLKEGKLLPKLWRAAVGIARTANTVAKVVRKNKPLAALGRMVTKAKSIGSKMVKSGAGKIAEKGAGNAENPVFTVSREQYPNHAKMLENAQKKGHSLEGLERGSGTRAAQKNRYQAQKEIRKQQGPPSKGYDYDEFPYASTKQGGAGSHVEPVLSDENQAVGRDLGKFYREQGIKENDKFDVKIID